MAPVSDGRCNMQCKGNAKEICGGTNGMIGSHHCLTMEMLTGFSFSGLSVYQFNGWYPQGCWSDNVNGQRALTYGAQVIGGANNMTNENCESACLAAGYSIAGTEYAGEW